MTLRALVLYALAASLATAAALGSRRGERPPDAAFYLPEEGVEGYTSSRACQACHPSEYASWYRSYHRTMTQPATPDTVLPEWNGVTLRRDGRLYRLDRVGDELFVEMPRPGTAGREPRERVRLPVLLTTGSHNMQYYWTPVPWASDGEPVRGQREFRRHCALCHDPEDESRALEGRGLDLEGMRRLWSLDAHERVEIELTQEDRAALSSFVERVQFPGRLVSFPFVYFARDETFLDDEHTFLQPPSRAGAVERYGKHWNRNCDGCHTTAPRYRWDETAEMGQTRLVELGIACEACHGAARRHVELRRSPFVRYREHLGLAEPDDVVNPAKLDANRASAVCAQCHAERLDRGRVGTEFAPGALIEDVSYVLRIPEGPRPEWLETALAEEPDLLANAFWPDGTMRIAGRDYNGLVESECYRKGGMSCLSCHDLHGGDPEDQLRPGARGDAICVSCHETEGEAGERHTHHQAASQGSRCMNCHMPYTTWGLLGGIRAHRITSPSASVSAATGRPDACNLCHLDGTLEETAHHLTEWYGQPESELPAEYRETAASLLWLLKGNAVQRALVAWHYRFPPALEASGDDWQTPFLAELLDDPYAAVRYTAARSLGELGRQKGRMVDPSASRIERWKAKRSVQARWRGSGTDARILLHEGAIRWERVQELLAARDDTPVTVAE